jgi:hypothetical protein
MGKRNKPKKSRQRLRKTSTEGLVRRTDNLMVRTKSPWGKMSEKLKSVAEPWTNRIDGVQAAADMAFVYDVSSLIWNASRLRGPAERNRALKEAEAILGPSLPELPRRAVRDLIEEIHERARVLYPDDPRLIVRVSVEDRGKGDFHVMVASLDAG